MKLMNLSKYLIIIFFIFSLTQFIFAADCEVLHCFKFTNSTGGSHNIGPQQGSCSFTKNFDVDGINYQMFSVPGLVMEAKGFKSYNLLCDNGWPDTALGFYLQRVAQFPAGTPELKANVASGLVPSSTGRQLCIGGGACPRVDGTMIGKGTLPSLNHTFNNIGGQSYKIYEYARPTAGETRNLNTLTPLSDINIYVGVPALLVFGPKDINSGFYETTSSYIKEITFTLINKSPLKLKLDNYEVICPRGQTDGFSCTIDKNYVNTFVEGGSGKTIIRGKITIDKTKLKTTQRVSGSVLLDVNYSSIDMNNNPNCLTYYKQNTFSDPMNFNYGLLDYQKFQVGLISQIDYNGCIGEDGMIGATGAEFAPRINIGFGGEATDGKVSIDECDTYDINGNVNPNWVYCSKKELLVELARKITVAWNLQRLIDVEMLKIDSNEDLINYYERELQKYLSFKANIRKQSFTQQKINISLGELDGLLNTLYANSGLEQTTAGEQKNFLRELFTKSSFRFNGGTFDDEISGTLNTGEYTVNIEIDHNKIGSQGYLFVDNNYNKTLNPKINITINFTLDPTTQNTPQVNWFFYDFGDEDFDNVIKDNSQKTFGYSNLINRGEVLVLRQDYANPDINSYVFSPSYAVPLFVRLKTNSLGDVNKTFTISNFEAGLNEFSSWTGFASSVENGCINISQNTSNTLPNLPYREFDSVNPTTPSEFLFTQFDNNLLPNQTVYLHTILFWPIDKNNNTINMSAPFKIYTKNNDNNNGPVRINEAIQGYQANNLNAVFNGIKERKICVHQDISTKKTIWTLFWNTTSVYSTIDQKKNAVVTTNNDANICQIKRYLGS